MKLNLSFKEFKNNHLKKNIKFYLEKDNCKNYYKVENLFRFL